MNEPMAQDQYGRRTVTFDDDKIFIQSTPNEPSPVIDVAHRINHNGLVLNEANNIRSSNPVRLTLEDLDDLVRRSEEEYIPGGFTNLSRDLEEELLNDIVDELDDEAVQRQRHLSSINSDNQTTIITRSPIELWKRVRLLIAVHLYKKNNEIREIPQPTSSTVNASTRAVVDNSRNRYETDFNIDHTELERKSTFGLIVLHKFSLDSSEEYQCVDFYDIGPGYVMMCNVVDLNVPKMNIQDYSNLRQLQSHYTEKCQDSQQILAKLKVKSPSPKSSKLLVYPIEKEFTNQIQSVEFDCPFQFNFMICIPCFRLILGFINMQKPKSLLVIIGDASRKGVFLSKQEIPDYVYSTLYVHQSSMLFVGCTGRVLSFNTQPLQNNADPLFISELANLPFEPLESIIDICQIKIRRAIGILSSRHFALWQYNPNGYLLLKFCNPHRYDFTRCHYNAKFDYLIFAFIDGLILIFQQNHMQQLRQYQYHWKTITDLGNSLDETLLISTSVDHTINVWKLDTLQHLYQYNSHEEILQIDVLQENLYYYRSLKNVVLFKLNLRTILFSIVKKKIKSLKLFSNLQRINRIVALAEDNSSTIISPISGCCLTYIPDIAKKPIKQILHDITRSTVYVLQFDGDIILYHVNNNPCVAGYIIRRKSKKSAITCMTLISPVCTKVSTNHIMRDSIEKAIIFFGHAHGCISLFQGDLLTMKPISAHQGSILCLETSRSSMGTSNMLFTTCEVLLSSSTDGIIYIWNLTLDQSDGSIQLVRLLTVQQEKNISFKPIQYLSMIDNFIVATYSDQKHLHLWQLLNISIKADTNNLWGIVEHPTKGSHHHSQIQAISATPKLKLFASSDNDGCIKIWDNTNSLLREIYFDEPIYAMEFLSHTNELIIAYQNNIHLILPEYYLPYNKKSRAKQQTNLNSIVEDNILEVTQPFRIPYESLPIFDYRIKTHHTKRRLERFERQLAGRFTVNESDSSTSDDENVSIRTSDHLSRISDDSEWAGLNEDIRDLLRMKKYEILYSTEQK